MDTYIDDWKLIDKHWTELMQVAISTSEGRLSSVTLMRRLRSNSRKNRIHKVFREVGRTVALLRYLADPALRRGSPRRPTKSSPTAGSSGGWASARTPPTNYVIGRIRSTPC
ncbi:Tn3 family transposase [Nonomuraea sp. NPDC005650]|uniref:Tn3 family transposase n=1 Tax=Nonomuraea sp. NPDC005650 TaxID=3157045 RepID=UPI0033ACB811